MLAYVRATKRVKGVQNKHVYYIGDVEEDGYTYFGDDISYRVPTPSTLTEEISVSVADVQVWYTVRNCWVRANYFTGLTLYGVAPDQIYNRIGDLEDEVASLKSRVTSLETRMTNAENRITDLEAALNTLNSRLGNFWQDIILNGSINPNNYNDLTSWFLDWWSDWTVLLNTLGDVANNLNLYSYDAAGNTIYYSDMASWMAAVKGMLRSSSNAERANANAIDTVSGNLSTLNTHLGDFWTSIIQNAGNNPNNYTNLSAWLQWVKNTANSAAQDAVDAYNLASSIDNLLGDIQTYVFDVPLYNPSQANNLAYWLRKVRGDVNTLMNQMANFDSSGQTLYPSGSLEEALLDTLQGLASLRTDLFGSTGRFVDIANEFTTHKNAINKLGKSALGPTYNTISGNGIQLDAVASKVNDLVDYVNGVWIGSMNPITINAFDNWTNI